MAAKSMTFSGDVWPTIRASCRCHVDKPQPPGQFSMSNYDDVMKDGVSGREVVPGKADSSNLFRRADRGEMPPFGRLGDADVSIFRQWIDQGAQNN